MSYQCKLLGYRLTPTHDNICSKQHYQQPPIIVVVLAIDFCFWFSVNNKITMDLLQRELHRKRQALERAKAEASFGSGGGDEHDKETSKKRKYLKLSDLRRIEEEEEEKERLRRIQQEKMGEDVVDKSAEKISSSSSNKKVRREGTKKARNERKKSVSTVAETKTKSRVPDDTQNAEDGHSISNTSSSADITRQLRQMGLVVRFYGESNEARMKRLKDALEQQSKALQGLSELEEFRLGKGHGIRNPFLEREKEQQQSFAKDHGKDPTRENDNAEGKAGKAKAEDDEDEDDQSDPPKLIYKFLKGLLKEWESDLAQRPENVAKSVVGKNETKTLKQCKDYIRPLFKLLKSRKLEDGLQFNLLKIVNFAKQGEFVKAHDAYMDVAIGRAAWPIGVTMVGIHARSGRAKIESSNVAHVMNSELQRKYLTSVKRLLTYAQKKRTDVDPSKKVA
jgi:pre-mRNA-splicing factor 18